MTISPNRTPLRPDYGATNRALQTSLARAALALARCGKSGQTKDVVSHISRHFGGDAGAIEIIQRSNVAPASLTTVTALKKSAISDLVDILGAPNASAALLPAGLQVTLGDAASVWVPGISSSPAGMVYTGEGAPFPVAAFDLSSGISLIPQKMTFGVVVSNEVLRSTNVEAIVRAMLIENARLGVDAVLFGDSEGTATTPAGLRYDVDALTPAAPTVIISDGVADDLTNLGAAVSGVGSPIYIASPAQALAIQTRLPLFKYPVLASSALSDGIVMAVAPRALAVASGDAIKIELADQATIHMNTVPTQITSSGVPTVSAFPVLNMFQLDSTCLKVTCEATWGLRCAGAVAWTTVGWGVPPS